MSRMALFTPRDGVPVFRVIQLSSAKRPAGLGKVFDFGLRESFLADVSHDRQLDAGGQGKILGLHFGGKLSGLGTHRRLLAVTGVISVRAEIGRASCRERV